MLTCQRHMVALFVNDERGCDLFGGPAQVARYACPPERADLMEAHQREHDRWEAAAMVAAAKAAEAAAAAKDPANYIRGGN